MWRPDLGPKVTETGRLALARILSETVATVISANTDGIVANLPPTPQARAAVRAIKCAKQWGPLMTMKFLLKRGAVNHANVALKFEERRHADVNRHARA